MVASSQQLGNTDWWKILVTAVVTALLTEPLKVWFTNINRKRRILQSVLMEASRNVSQGQNLVDLHSQGGFTTSDGVALQSHEQDLVFCKAAASVFRTCRYDAALQDLYLFYSLPESDWIDAMYDSWKRFHHGSCPQHPVEFIQQTNAKFIEGAATKASVRHYLLKVGADYVKQQIHKFSKYAGRTRRQRIADLYHRLRRFHF